MSDTRKAPPPRERWLRVVRDDESPPPPPAEPEADASPPPAPDPAPNPAPSQQAAGPAASQKAASLPAPGMPAPPNWPAEPTGARLPASRATPALPSGLGPDAPDAAGGGAATGRVGAPGRVGRRWAGLRGAGVIGDIAELLVLVVVGVAAALPVDGFIGPLDGQPPVHAFLVLALPFWDRLPRRIPVRLAEIAILLAAVGAVWLGLAALGSQSWWRAEVACGLACALVGAARILLAATLGGRRTVNR